MFCNITDGNRKEGNAYLTTHSTHLCLRPGAGRMVKNDTDSEREETHCRHLTSRASARDPVDRIGHITAFVTPVVEYWLERKIAQWVHEVGSTRRSTES